MNNILIERLNDAAGYELDIGRSQLFEAAALRIKELEKERDIRDLEQQAKGRIDGVAYALNMYCVHMSPKEFPAIGEYYANQVLNKDKAIKGGE